MPAHPGVAHPQAMTLETPRLWLRPMREDDEAFFCALYGDPQVMRRVAPAMQESAARVAFGRMLRQAAARPAGAYYWTILPRGRASCVGLIALVPDRAAPTSAECGILLQAASQDRGFATEAIATVAHAAFATCGMSCVWTRHHPANLVVTRLMHRLGFTRRAAPADDGVRWQVTAADPAVQGWAAAGFAKPAAGR